MKAKIGRIGQTLKTPSFKNDIIYEGEARFSATSFSLPAYPLQNLINMANIFLPIKMTMATLNNA
jgi:hypothetical protein